MPKVGLEVCLRVRSYCNAWAMGLQDLTFSTAGSLMWLSKSWVQQCRQELGQSSVNWLGVCMEFRPGAQTTHNFRYIHKTDMF